MTDRYQALIVTLDHDIRSDDAEPLMQAIRMLRGVLDVSGDVSDLSTHIAAMRVRRELGEKLADVLYPAKT